MPFRVSLSGLDATSSALDVVANNIANSNTTGFKTSRVNFADVYATGSLNLSSLQTGEGVTVASIDQQFTQGNITQTGNNLDLAISGQGFFTLHDASGYYYTRNGTFSVDRTGYVVNSQNQRLQVYPALPNGTFNTGALQDLQLNTSQSAPQATANIAGNLNLPANAPVPTDAAFSPTDPLSYNNTTSTAVYDSLGYQHTASFYFIKQPGANAWNVAMTVDGTQVGGQIPLQFDSAGNIQIPPSPVNASYNFGSYTPSTGASAMNLTVDLTGSTQYGNQFAVNTVTQDGYSTGQLTTINVDNTGVVSAKYTNGRSLTLGQLSISNFPNPQGLAPLGHSNWSETFSSGNVIRGTAGSSNIGLIQSGALETSNVDLTKELVDMITAQRAFQANAQMITTDDQITQTILQIR
ncbi:MAG: flagellar hook protein FlgE [Proteobacteria bacterium]|nr:flagellar hook protein FlgE [Pseudomonadota bacterium]